MSEAGYVSIHRRLLGHHAFRNDAEGMAFAWMVIRAAWRPAKVRYKDRMIQLRRGQLAVSVRDMANAMDRDKAWVERLWKRLKSETMIETVTEAGVSVVTICNYDEYQASRDSDETPRETAGETSSRQARDTEQRREEDNKIDDDVDDASEREIDPVVVDFPADLMSLTDRICRSGGVRNLEPASIGRNMDFVKGWLAEGFDPETMILPAVAAAIASATEPISSLKYFDRPIRQFRARMEAQGNGYRGPQSHFRGHQPSAAVELRRRAEAELAALAASDDDQDHCGPWPALPAGQSTG